MKARFAVMRRKFFGLFHPQKSIRQLSTHTNNQRLSSHLAHHSVPLSNGKEFVTKSKDSRIGFAFDIDGVLLRGQVLIPGATEALQLLKKHDIPFVFVTNGGGTLEATKAESLTRLLNFPIHPTQVQLAHSPMRELAAIHGHDLCLLVGKSQIKDIAHDYGFHNVVTMGEIHSQMPAIFPDTKPEKMERVDKWLQPIGAVLGFMDPLHWARDLQILVDVLRSDGGKIGTIGEYQSVPLYYSGPDMEYPTDFPTPRFGAGSFLYALGSLYNFYTGQELKATSYGKPLTTTYRYAERLLRMQAEAHGHEGVHHVYAIGDNPKSDIKGANAAGSHWTSVLVRTGMFQKGENDKEHPAKIVAPDALSAIKQILKQEQIV